MRQRDASDLAPPQDPEGSAAARILAPLGARDFRWLFVSNVFFFFAMGSQQVARAWLAFELTGSEFDLGLTMLAVSLPMTVLSAFGGVAADRLERRRLILIGQALAAACQLVVSWLILTERIAFWHLMVSAAVMGCVFPFIMPARQAIVANVVGMSRLTSAMSLNMMAMNATRVVGPAAAGFLIAGYGIGPTYLLGSALMVLAWICVLFIGPAAPAAPPRGQSMWNSLSEGISYLGERRLILILLTFGLIPTSLAMPFQNLLVVFTEEVWEVGADGFGLLSAMGGLGGTIGALWVAGQSEAHRLRKMVASGVAFGLLLFLFSQSPWYQPAIALVFLANIFASVFTTLNNTSIQMLIPDAVRGRISSFLMMSFSLPMLGTLPVSFAAEIYGAPIAIGACALLASGVTLVYYAASPALRRVDAELDAEAALRAGADAPMQAGRA